MSKFALVLSPVALAALAACATSEPAPPVAVTPAPPVVVVVPPSTTGGAVAAPAERLRAGVGRVESIVEPSQAASAGATTQNANRRLTVRMEDGSVQEVVTPATTVVAVGDRVEISANGLMRRRAQ